MQKKYINKQLSEEVQELIYKKDIWTYKADVKVKNKKEKIQLALKKNLKLQQLNLSCQLETMVNFMVL